MWSQYPLKTLEQVVRKIHASDGFVGVYLFLMRKLGWVGEADDIRKIIGAQGGSFDEFWAAYPPRKGRKVGKKATAAAFAKLRDEDKSGCIQAAKNYARERRDYPKDPERFLKNDHWRDWLAAAPAGDNEAPSGGDSTNDKAYVRARQDAEMMLSLQKALYKRKKCAPKYWDADDEAMYRGDAQWAVGSDEEWIKREIRKDLQ